MCNDNGGESIIDIEREIARMVAKEEERVQNIGGNSNARPVRTAVAPSLLTLLPHLSHS